MRASRQPAKTFFGSHGRRKEGSRLEGEVRVGGRQAFRMGETRTDL